MSSNAFDKLDSFLCDLEENGISYTLAHNRDEALMVIAVAPGERWEIEFLRDGSVEIEKFFSSGKIHGEKALGELFARYAEEHADWESQAEAVTVASE